MNEIQLILKEYAELKLQEKVISEKLSELNPVIKEYLSDQGVDKLPTSMGNFSLGSRTIWQYSDAVTKLQEKEKAEGIAKKVTSVSLIFTTPKIKETKDE